jgi:hypothetical protein
LRRTEKPRQQCAPEFFGIGPPGSPGGSAIRRPHAGLLSATLARANADLSEGFVPRATHIGEASSEASFGIGARPRTAAQAPRGSGGPIRSRLSHPARQGPPWSPGLRSRCRGRKGRATLPLHLNAGQYRPRCSTTPRERLTFGSKLFSGNGERQLTAARRSCRGDVPHGMIGPANSQRTRRSVSRDAERVGQVNIDSGSIAVASFPVRRQSLSSL